MRWLDISDFKYGHTSQLLIGWKAVDIILRLPIFANDHVTGDMNVHEYDHVYLQVTLVTWTRSCQPPHFV